MLNIVQLLVAQVHSNPFLRLCMKVLLPSVLCYLKFSKNLASDRQNSVYGLLYPTTVSIILAVHHPSFLLVKFFTELLFIGLPISLISSNVMKLDIWKYLLTSSIISFFCLLSRKWSFYRFISGPRLFGFLLCISLLLDGVCALARSFIYPAPFISVLASQVANSCHPSNSFSDSITYFTAITPSQLKLNALIWKPKTNSMVVPIVKSPPSSKYIFFYLGGNAQTMDTSFECILQSFHGLMIPIVLFDHRSVGQSEGMISNLQDLVQDAKAVVNTAMKREGITDAKRVIILGHSIGGGVASQLASEHFPEASLILDRTFSTLSDVVVSMMSINPRLYEFLEKIGIGELNTIEHWNNIKHTRKLVVYHKQDEIIGYKTSSLARLPQFQSGGDHKFTLELLGNTESNHNCPFNNFQNYSTIVSQLDNFMKSTAS